MNIGVKQLNKAFGDTAVLRNFSAEFAEGKRTAILGPSGSGKTTLIEILLGLQKADSGAVSGLPDRAAAVFQEDRLLQEWSAEANIAAVLNKRFWNDLPGTIKDHLTEVELSESGRQRAGTLSGGMKRRVALVRAVMAAEETVKQGKSVLLVLDEPFKGLDDVTKEKTVDYLKRRTEGITTLLITHDEDDITALGCSAVVRLGE